MLRGGLRAILRHSAMSRAHRFEVVDENRTREAEDPEAFDRVAFALRALGALRPPGLTVAVYRRHGAMKVDTVRDLRGGEGARWAMGGIPPRASRAHIALALAELAGVTDVPYAVDILLHAGREG